MSDGYTNPVSFPPTPDGWNVVAIEDICQNVTSGGTPLRSNQSFYQGGIYSWFKTQELNDSILYESEEKITDKALELSSAKLFPKGTVLMAMYGDGKTITSLGILSKEAATNQACCAMLPNPNLCDSRFLFYALKYHRDDFIQIASGGAQRNLSGKLIRRFALNIPPLPEQHAIAHILGTLDDKIELNRRMNETLESMAQAIFKSWFVDFDPVRAKAEGRDTGLPEEIADLFPDSFEETELGEVPKGWHVVQLGDMLKLLKDGSHNPPKRIESGIRFIAGATNIKNFSIDFSSCTFISQEDYEKIHKKWVIEPNDVLLTIVGTVGNVALVHETDLPFSLQRSIAVLRSIDELKPTYLYYLIKSAYFQSEIAKRLNPTAQPGIYLGELAKIKVLKPQKDVVREFDTLTEKIISKMRNNLLEIDYLQKVRDSLLPKLISGKVRVINDH